MSNAYLLEGGDSKISNLIIGILLILIRKLVVF